MLRSFGALSLFVALLAAPCDAFALSGGAQILRRQFDASASSSLHLVLMKADDATNKKLSASTLTISAEAKAERAEKREQVTKGLPVAIILAFAVNAATGGGLQDLDMPTLNAPGLAEAKALKAKSEQKSAAYYENLRTGGD